MKISIDNSPLSSDRLQVAHKENKIFVSHTLNCSGKMAVYCWGNTIHGELGLGGIEEELILSPREMNWLHAAELLQAACGSGHTLLLTYDGKVFSCGSNDYGQLGHEQNRKRPQPVLNLDNYCITQVGCGDFHSLALNEWGQVFSWGSDTCGQLGHNNGNSSQSQPKIVKSLATKQIVRIACGSTHCLALTNNGDIYSWGANTDGQLGLGFKSDKVSTPTQLKSLAGIPIAFLACGGNHSFAISKSGAVFGWGKNTYGQLGLNDESSRLYPSQLKTLRSLGVRYIACGQDFSVFLTFDGGVFTCGSGTYGQLGHGMNSNEILPRMVVELMGSTITQITCGGRHTLALVASRGRVYGFGLGCSGQLGTKFPQNSSVPQVVLGPWVSPSGTALIDKADEADKMNDMTVKRIFSGGDHCLVAATEYSKQIPPDDYRFYETKTQILYLTTEMAEACSKLTNEEKVDLELLSAIELIFKSQACINGSFLLQNEKHFCCTSKHPGLDIDEATKAFECIRKIENDSLKQIIWDSITTELFSTLVPSPADVETLRVYLIIPLYHEFINAKNYVKLHTPFGEAILRLHAIPLKIVSQWWAFQSMEYYEMLVGNFKSVVMYIINFGFTTTDDKKKMITYEPNMALALNLLLALYRINHVQRNQKINYENFHMPELIESVDIQQDYIKWLVDKTPNSFYLCNYPFIFDAKAKTLLLQTDQAMQMQNAMHNAATRGMFMMFTGSPYTVPQFVVLNVSRENIVADTLTALSQFGANELKKPLKVKFFGEEAEDAGGVRKEFFMLLLKDILDPKYGMFKEFEDSRAIWFSDHSFEGEEMYFLIGVICGLAIYNFTIINLPFPLALYKKLLKEPVDMSDLRDLSPTVARSMQSILDYEDDDLQDVFELHFEISTEVFGENKVIALKEGGEDIAVTQQNKQEFVDLYIDYIFNKSCEKHFKGFSMGFMKVCGGRVMELFRPHELMAVVVGNEDYDWHVFESNAEYKNGYTSGDQTIRLFWEVFHELDLKEKKKFLLFLTGSDRIPIQGMKAIRIAIQPVSDERALPVAHTCFNLLDLPRYSTKERLKYKLLQAIQQTQGFSLV